MSLWDLVLLWIVSFLYTYNGITCFLIGKNEQGTPRLSGLPYALLSDINVYQDSMSGQKPGSGVLLSPCPKPSHHFSGSWYSPGSTFLLHAEPPWFTLFRPQNWFCPGAHPSRCMKTSSKPVELHISNLFSGWVGN